MAARLRRTHQETVRAKIQTSQLINRLEKHALGELDLSASQIKAIEVLIRKTLPDLSAVTIESDDGKDIPDYDMSRLDDAELDAVERALAKAAVVEAGEDGEGEEVAS
jgi:hypothetical protein